MTDEDRGSHALEHIPWRMVLLIVLFAALAVRLYGLDWDDGADLHPDELFIAKIVLIDRIHVSWPLDVAQLLDPARSGLNPRSADPATGRFREFAYGALPLWVTDLTAALLTRVTGTNWNGMDHAYLVGRVLTATLSALTIVPIAAIGRAIGGPRVALLSALIAALAPMSVQLAHYFTTDCWLTFFVSLALLFSVLAARDGRGRQFALAGAAFGLAMASKGSVFALAVPLACALTIDAWRVYSTRQPVQALRRILRNGAFTALASLGAFAIFEPYALLRPDVYLQSLRTQADIVSGAFDVPFTRVYAGTTPFVYQAEQFVRWGYGPAAGLLALFGLILLLRLAIRERSSAALILVSWFIPYTAVLIVADVKFLRYLEPLAPVFAVGAALAVITLAKAATTWRPAVGRIVIPAALLLSMVWTAAFLSIYSHENTRVAATKWIYGAIPAGSRITAEYWDDALPRSLSYALSPGAFGYATVLLDLYRDLPPPEASDALFQEIERADFIIQSSDRVEAAMAAAPWRYPVQDRYFEQLAAGNLGFRLAAEFSRAPAIAGIQVDDRQADESFKNYDHPSVTIYQRADGLTQGRWDQAMAWALQRPWYPSRQPERPTLLLDQPVGQNPAVNDARWSAGTTASTPFALAVWVLMLAALALVGAPIARALCPRFPDAGLGLARPIALIVAAYPVWLGASLQWFSFRAIWAAVAMIVVGILGWRMMRISPMAASPRAWWPRGSIWKQSEAAFWLVFLLFLAFRFATPDGWHPFWGGEKPMEFAQINAISRSAFFPPYDPWYADGYVNYYYYGFYLIAFLLKVTGIPAEIGLNLALPATMGMLASGAFSVGAAVSSGIERSPRWAAAGGWLAVATTCLLGNLSAVRGAFAGGADRFDPFVFWTWNGSRAIDNAITEFPFFTGLYADLHAHVVALPVTVVVIGVAFALTTDSARALQARGISSASAMLPIFGIRIGILALALGTLSATNMWDVPVYATLAIAASFMATAPIKPWRRRTAVFVGLAAVIGGGTWLLFLPFHQAFVSLFSQLALVHDPTDPIQFMTHLGGFVVICAFGLAVLLMARTPGSGIPALWAVVGVAALLGAMVLLAPPIRTPALELAGSLLLIVSLAGPPLAALWHLAAARATGERARWIIGVMALGLALLLVLCVVFDRTVLGLTLGFGIAAAGGWLLLSRQPDRFLCLLLAGAFFTAAGAEVVVIADDLINTVAYRMNTVFKFYNQVWILLALSSACLLVMMVRRAIASSTIAPARARHHAGIVGWARAGAAIAALVIAGAALYPLLATRPRLAQRFDPGAPAGSLNALAWMDEGTIPFHGETRDGQIAFAGDAAAIDWFFQNVEGTPVIAEASIGPYRCNGTRISNATGLPTIIGWERHQQQQRYPETLPGRVEDVRTLYTSADVNIKADILDRYNVEFVVVGDLERTYPLANNECTATDSDAGIRAFDRMIGETLEIAHAENGTTIYRVLPIAERA